MKKLFLLLTVAMGICLPVVSQAADAQVQNAQGVSQEVQGNPNASYQGNYGRGYAQDGRYEGRGYAQDGRGYAQDGRGYAQDGRYEGRGYAQDGRGYAQDGRGYAQDGRGYDGRGYGQGAYAQGGFEGAQAADHIDPNQEYTIGDNQDDGCGNCYCLCCKYEPCYYNTWRTECEPVCCKKKCCHYVPKYYEKCCVKYVPQNYTQTCCKYEPEYYYTDETKYVSKRVCDRHCKYVPKYYYKRSAAPVQCCPQPAACCQ